MANLSLSDIHDIQMTMIKKFDAFCAQNHLVYFLCAGTLLGAVRHESFIPWDDDVDLSMPRDDFERMIEMLDNNPLDGMSLFHCGKDEYSLPFAKLSDNNTVLQEEGTIDQHTGVFIDLFPIDGLSNNWFSRKIRILRSKWDFFVLNLKQEVPSPKSLICKLILFFYRRTNVQKMAYRINNSAKKRSFYVSKNNCVLVHSTLTKNICFKEDFFPTKKTYFNGVMLPIPNNAQKILEQLYGHNYMTPPPEDKRTGKHKVDVFLKGDL